MRSTHLARRAHSVVSHSAFLHVLLWELWYGKYGARRTGRGRSSVEVEVDTLEWRGERIERREEPGKILDESG